MLFLLDSIIVLSSIFFGYFILKPDLSVFTTQVVIASAITIAIAHHFFAWRYGLYRKVWSYASIRELKAIFKAVTLSIVVVACIQLLLVQHISIRALFLTWMLHLLLIGGSRLSWRVVRDNMLKTNPENMKRTLIIGAGQAGTVVVRQMANNPDSGMKPVAFLDDDRRKQGLEIHGVSIIGNTKNVEDYVRDNDIDKIVIAILQCPSLK